MKMLLHDSRVNRSTAKRSTEDRVWINAEKYDHRLCQRSANG